MSGLISETWSQLLTSQTLDTRHRLIASHPHCALAVVSAASALARSLVFRALFLPSSVSDPDSSASAIVPNNVLNQTAMNDLFKLGLLAQCTAVDEQWIRYKLTDISIVNLQRAVCGRSMDPAGASTVPMVAKADLKPSKADALTIDQLNSFADREWEKLLKLLVNPESADGSNTSSAILDVLREVGLLKGQKGKLEITSAAFQFLLQDTASQVWHLVSLYIRLKERTEGQSLVDILSVICRIHLSILGQDYYLKGDLTPAQQHVITFFNSIGLVLKQEKTYYPTRLATGLLEGQSKGEMVGISDANDSGFIVLETNFRLYAYTDSELHISLLSLFVELRYRFPNMVVGHVTRKSVNTAFRRGITCEQILRFLEVNAHANMKALSPVIPVTVSDQIRLWERERSRLLFTPAYMYLGFETSALLKQAVKYAEDNAALLASHEGANELNRANTYCVVRREDHPTMKQFFARMK